jgi:hypothetical protein
MNIEKIENLVIIIRNSSFEEGTHFFSEDKDYQQVGIWEYNKGKELIPHKHIIHLKSIERTQEVIYIIKGKVEAYIYNDNENLVKSTILCSGDTMITLNGGHGYKVLEDGTRVLEVKNGPYLGRSLDRKDITI